MCPACPHVGNKGGLGAEGLVPLGEPGFSAGGSNPKGHVNANMARQGGIEGTEGRERIVC